MWHRILSYGLDHPERLKMLMSIGTNIVARTPSLLVVFVLLPMISRALGVNQYGELLGALALGGLFLLPFGGNNVVARRLIGGAYGRGEPAQEASAFATITVCAALAAVIMAMAVLAVGYFGGNSAVFCIIAVIPVFGAFLNTFDNVRASYNEHYVTAGLFFFTQLTIVGIVLFFGVPSDNQLSSAFIMVGGGFISSFCTLLLLLRRRPYLLTGRPFKVLRTATSSLRVLAADGVLFLSLPLGVYWLAQTGSLDIAGWYGTVVRIYRSLSIPMILVMLPLASYIATRWGHMDPEKRVQAHRLFLAFGVGYGAVVGVLVFLFMHYAINWMYGINVYVGPTEKVALAVFFGGIVAQKSYAQLLFSVCDARLITKGTPLVVVVGILVALAGSVWLTPIQVISAMGVCIVLPLFPVLFLEMRYQCRAVPRSQTPPNESNFKENR